MKSDKIESVHLLFDKKMEISQNILKRASKIKLLLMDCDGVLTDGRITYLPNGEEQKTFHVRDGMGITLLHKAGVSTGIISGRNSSLVVRRAEELKIKFVYQGIDDKKKVLDEIISLSNIEENEIAYIGDDVNDIILLQKIGLAVSVADAVKEVKQVSHLETQAKGGNGAVREVCEIIIKAKSSNLA